jgi:flagellar basal body-associated protein FliL
MKLRQTSADNTKPTRRHGDMIIILLIVAVVLATASIAAVARAFANDEALDPGITAWRKSWRARL